jgi:ECF sigma factor
MRWAPTGVDVLDLHATLDELAGFGCQKGQVAELRFFGGLSLEEPGHVLDLSIATVEREWQAARAWPCRIPTFTVGRQMRLAPSWSTSIGSRREISATARSPASG